MSDVPETEPTTGAPVADPDEHVMDLLAEHVPLALLVDLITPQGPASEDILRTEGMPDDAWWEAEDDGAAAAADGSARSADDEAGRRAP